MLNEKVLEQVSDLMNQALSEESVGMAAPMTDVEIKLLTSVIDQIVDEGKVSECISLVIKPRNLIESIKQSEFAEPEELRARKTLRRFFEIFINLTVEPETRIIN